MKKVNQLAKEKKQPQISLFSIKTKLAIKFPNNFFFLPKIILALKGLSYNTKEITYLK